MIINYKILLNNGDIIEKFDILHNDYDQFCCIFANEMCNNSNKEYDCLHSDLDEFLCNENNIFTNKYNFGILTVEKKASEASYEI